MKMPCMRVHVFLRTNLADFGVEGKVVAVRPGPVITTYEFEPAPGVKVNRVVSLADDLQMALACGVRAYSRADSRKSRGGYRGF